MTQDTGYTRFSSFLLKHVLPAEWVTLAGLLALSLGTALLHMPLLMPGARAYLVFIIYFIPTYFLLPFLYRSAKHGPLRGIGKIFRVYVCFFITCYLVYDIKHWSHLLHSHYQDALYQSWDAALAPLIAWERKLNDLLALPVSNEWYVLVFQSLFYLAFPLCFLAGARRFHACCAALAANMVLGGLSYSIAPALGPFIYWPKDQWNPLLQNFYDNTMAFASSGGASYNSDNFLRILGAMPSMHISIPLTFTWYLWKTHPLPGLIGALATLYCFMHAKFTGFHYYADLIAGVVLCAAAIAIADRLTACYLRHNAPPPQDSERRT